MDESHEAIKAVIFDWAGTVVDFGSVAPASTFVRVFAQAGVAITDAEARLPMGLEKRDHIRALFALPEVAARWRAASGAAPSDEDVDACYDAFLPLQLEVVAAHAVPIPGVVDAVATLRSRGVGIGSDTGYAREIMDVLIPAAAADGFRPDVVVTPDDVAAPRPAPDMAVAVAAQLGVDEPWRCVKVDDTAAGIDEGRNAGMWTVGVADTGNATGLSYEDWVRLPDAERALRRERARDLLLAAGAHVVIGSAADIVAVVDELGGRVRKGERP